MTSCAVYFDFENVHAQVLNMVHGEDAYDNQPGNNQPNIVDLDAIFNHIRSIGRIVVAKAYANWVRLGSYGTALMTNNVDTIQLFSRGRLAKNGADIRMSLDCLEDATQIFNADIFIIISNDSDFSGLVQKLQSRGKQVIGIGTRKVSRYLVSCCDSFTYYEDIVPGLSQSATKNENSTAATKPHPPKITLDHAKRTLLTVVRDAMTRHGVSILKLAQIKPMMMIALPGFSEAHLGFANFGAFMAACDDLVSVRSGPNDKLVSLVAHAEESTNDSRLADPEVVRLAA